jgi:hypothetical protein
MLRVEKRNEERRTATAPLLFIRLELIKHGNHRILTHIIKPLEFFLCEGVHMAEHSGLRVTEYMVRLIASELTDIELNNVLLVGRVEGNPKRMQVYPKVAAFLSSSHQAGGEKVSQTLFLS